jgi:AcrR family transcriptional regulator
VATARTPRSAWIDAARHALAAGGPEAVRIETLATRLGVTKGGFYWHFADRQALLDEVLDTWEQTTVDDVIARVEERPADPRALLRRFFDEVAPSTDLTEELAIRDWARRDEAVAKRLRRIDTRRLAWMRSVFGQFCVDDDDAAGRSMLAYSLLIGSLFIVAQHDGRSQGDVVRLGVDRLLG